MAVKIILDSTANVNPCLADQFYTVPLTVHFAEKEYIDGVTIDHNTFYTMLQQSQALPSTSQPTPASFADLYEKICTQGDTAVVITISSKLSGTYQSASIAAQEYADRVYVVDSLSATIGTGILAEYALRLSGDGMDAQQLAQELESKKSQICLVAVLDTLEYLKRGGRISKTVAFAGALLSIKPVIGVAEGVVEMLGKARGAKAGAVMLSQQVESNGGVDENMPYLYGYTGLSDTLLVQYLESTDCPQTLPIAPIGSVIGTHAGPGAYAIAFFKKQ